MSYSHAGSMRGHVAIVTGAAQGVGKGVAGALLERGAAVLLVDIQEEVLATTAAELQAIGRVERLVADLRDPDSAQRIAAAAIDAFGTVHGLVNNAIATNEPKAFVDITTEDLALGYDVGPRATFLLMQAVHPLMVKEGGGSIVNLGSGTGTGGEPKWGGYAAAKEGIRGLSKVAALEVGTRQHPRQRHLPVRRVGRRQVLEVVRAQGVRKSGGAGSDEAHRRRPHRCGRAGGVFARW